MRGAGIVELAMRLHRAPVGRDEAAWGWACGCWVLAMYGRGWSTDDIVGAVNSVRDRLEAGGDA